MSYNLEKKVSRDAGKAAKTTFGIIGAFLGSAFGGRPSTRRSRPTGFSRRRPRRW